MAAGEIYRARTGGVSEVGGRRYYFGPATTIREGHPLHTAHPELFEQLVPDYEYEPPEPAAPKAARSAKAIAGSESGK